MPSRLRCWLSGHDYPDWPTWTHSGRGAFHRRRFCGRCHREQVETDG